MRVPIVLLLAAAALSAQTPSGRWDGTITLGTLKVPFRMEFEGTPQTLKGSFVNGDAKVRSNPGSFAGKKLFLKFDKLGSRMEATLADGVLKGTYATHPFTASAYCTCSFEGEAGANISGTWNVPAANWQLTIERKGEDTLATLSRQGLVLGPLVGRFNGAFFALNYFDGTLGAVLEIDPQKDGTLNLDLSEHGQKPSKHKAIRAK